MAVGSISLSIYTKYMWPCRDSNLRPLYLQSNTLPTTLWSSSPFCLCTWTMRCKLIKLKKVSAFSPLPQTNKIESTIFLLLLCKWLSHKRSTKCVCLFVCMRVCCIEGISCTLEHIKCGTKKPQAWLEKTCISPAYEWLKSERKQLYEFYRQSGTNYVSMYFNTIITPCGLLYHCLKISWGRCVTLKI